MVQNTSAAVMAQRIEPQDSLDDFPTPPWGSRVGVLHALYRDDVPFTLPPANGHGDTRWRHIPPCRRPLERADDYPEWAAQARLMNDDQLGKLLLRHANGKAKPPMPEAVIRAELLSRGIGDQSVWLRAA